MSVKDINLKLEQMTKTVDGIRAAINKKGVSCPDSIGLRQFPEYISRIAGFDGVGLASVAHDESLEGLGTEDEPLGVRLRDKYQTTDVLEINCFAVTVVDRKTITPYRSYMREGDLICDMIGTLAYISQISGNDVSCVTYLPSKIAWSNIGGNPEDNKSVVDTLGKTQDFLAVPGETFVSNLNAIYEIEQQIDAMIDNINGTYSI